MSSMVGHTTSKLNQLERELPEGLLVDAAWFETRGYSRQLRSHYVSAGWLEQPTRGVYRRPRGNLNWQQAIISLQTILLKNPLTVGGKTALQLQGYEHYLRLSENEVHLYGPKPPPKWLYRLPLDRRFKYHNSEKLFNNDPITVGLGNLKWNVEQGDYSGGVSNENFSSQVWGQWDWPLTFSTPERAVFELLDQLPRHESFHQADKILESLGNLRPRRLQKLLQDCRSIKVKRLFFFFADRHRHAWLKRIEKGCVNLGSGKREIFKGGKLDRTYLITVPEDLDAL